MGSIEIKRKKNHIVKNVEENKQKMYLLHNLNHILS